jgi:hypothetical protein
MAEDLAREDREFEQLLAQGEIISLLFLSIFFTIEEQLRQTLKVEAEALIENMLVREKTPSPNAVECTPLATVKVVESPSVVQTFPLGAGKLSFAAMVKVVH